MTRSILTLILASALATACSQPSTAIGRRREGTSLNHSAAWRGVYRTAGRGTCSGAARHRATASGCRHRVTIGVVGCGAGARDDRAARAEIS